MSRKQKPDTVLKSYWSRNAEFADLFNAYLYGGKPVIKASELEERDTESSIVLRTDSVAETRQAARDLFKVAMTAGGIQYVLLGIENQEHIHYAMPLRDLEYCTYSYLKQYDKIKEKYPKKDGLSGNEFLSYMKKTDKLIPVITLVIYYGDEEWDGAKSLYEMMDIPEELKPFVNDCKMNLIEARNTELVFHNKNNKDMFHLFRVMCDENKDSMERRKEANDYAENNQVDKTVVMAIGACNGINMKALREEDKGMNTLFKEIEKEGRVKGEAIGEARGEARGETNGRIKEIISLGKEFNMDEGDIIKKIQERMKISATKSREYYDKFKRQDA